MIKLAVIHRWLSYQGSVRKLVRFTRLTMLIEPCLNHWSLKTTNVWGYFMPNDIHSLTIYIFPRPFQWFHTFVPTLIGLYRWNLIIIEQSKANYWKLDFEQVRCGCLIEGNKQFGNNLTGWCLTYRGGALMQWQLIVKRGRTCFRLAHLCRWSS